MNVEKTKVIGISREAFPLHIRLETTGECGIFQQMIQDVHVTLNP